MGLPFFDFVSEVRDWTAGLFSSEAEKGEKANDYEEVGPGDPRFDEIYNKVVTATSTMTQRALLDQAIAEQKAKETQTLMLLLGGGIVAFAFLGNPRKSRRRRRR